MRSYLKIPTFQWRGERYRCTVIFCGGWRFFWAPDHFEEGRVYRLRLGPVMFKAMVDDPHREIPTLSPEELEVFWSEWHGQNLYPKVKN